MLAPFFETPLGRPEYSCLLTLDEVNLTLELLRILWRLAEGSGWIAGRQCVHVNRMIDEVGRMAGAWRKSVARRDSGN